MRLCIISHAYLETAYLPVLEALAAHPDVQLAWITPKEYRLNLQTSSGTFNGGDQRFATYPIPIRLGSRQGAFLYKARDLRAALDRFKPDLILHEQEVFALSAAQVAWVARNRRIPIAMFVWENTHRSRRWVRDFVLKHSAGIIAGSNSSAAMHKEWGFSGLMKVLPQMGTALTAVPSRGFRVPGKFRICYVGRLIASKGVDTLLRALAELQTEDLAIQCTIAGRGEERERLERLAHELSLEAVVSFAGVLPQDQTKALIRRSDVLVLPSRRTKDWEEQFGRVLIEAMAEGTVPLGTNTGAIPEVIGSAAAIFEQDDVHGLAKLLKRFAHNEQLLREQQEAMFVRAQTNYSHEVVTLHKVAFLQQILQQSRS